MNIFLLGNGFDLHYHLPTTYKDFLNTIDFLCKNKEKTFHKVSDVFEPLANDGKNSWFSQRYNKYKNGYQQVDLPQTDLSEFIEIASKNEWVQYFCQRRIKGGGWIDFEREIRKVIILLEYVFGVLFKEDEYGFAWVNHSHSDVPVQKKADIRSVIEDFSLGKFFDGSVVYDDNLYEQCCRAYLSTVPPDVVIFHSKYSRVHPESPRDIGLNIDAIVSSMLSSLHEFSWLLSKYLSIFVEEPLKYFAKEKIITLDDAFRNPDAVVTLNYTNTFETLYCNDSKAEVHHIHGTNKTSIVLGVNADEADELSALNTRFQGFKKYYQRVVNQTDSSYLELVQSLQTTPNPLHPYKCLFVFGHSLDITDKDIIVELFNIADKISIYYYDQKELANYVERLVSIYGKKNFDRLRVIKGLGFYPAGTLNDNWHLDERIYRYCSHAPDFGVIRMPDFGGAGYLPYQQDNLFMQLLAEYLKTKTSSNSLPLRRLQNIIFDQEQEQNAKDKE